MDEVCCQEEYFFFSEYNIRASFWGGRAPKAVDEASRSIFPLEDLIRQPFGLSPLEGATGIPSHASRRVRLIIFAGGEIYKRETGARLYQLDPVVTGESSPEAKDAYIDTMRENMKVLKEALQ